MKACATCNNGLNRERTSILCERPASRFSAFSRFSQDPAHSPPVVAVVIDKLLDQKIYVHFTSIESDSRTLKCCIRHGLKMICKTGSKFDELTDGLISIAVIASGTRLMQKA